MKKHVLYPDTMWFFLSDRIFSCVVLHSRQQTVFVSSRTLQAIRIVRESQTVMPVLFERLIVTKIFTMGIIRGGQNKMPFHFACHFGRLFLKIYSLMQGKHTTSCKCGGLRIPHLVKVGVGSTPRNVG